MCTIGSIVSENKKTDIVDETLRPFSAILVAKRADTSDKTPGQFPRLNKPKPDRSLTLTKWLLCLNLTQP